MKIELTEDDLRLIVRWYNIAYQEGLAGGKEDKEVLSKFNIIGISKEHKYMINSLLNEKC